MNGNPPTSNQIIGYESGTTRWINDSVFYNGATQITPKIYVDNANTSGGSVTFNYSSIGFNNIYSVSRVHIIVIGD